MSKFVAVCDSGWQGEYMNVHGPFRAVDDAIEWLEGHCKRCPLKQEMEDHYIVPLKRAHKPKEKE